MTKNNNSLIFWCGAILNHKGLKRYNGETPAASQWSRGLLNGLIQSKVDVKVFAPIWDSYFPKGTLVPNNSSCLESNFDQTEIPYINLPYLRTESVALSLYYKLENSIKEKKPYAILNYNTYPHYCKALKKIKLKYPEIKWINIILDLDDPLKDNWSKFLKDTEGSDGSVFLSWWGFEHAPIRNKLHLDGGWDGLLPENITPITPIFLYAGKFAKYGGIQDIIKSIQSYPRQNVIFEFYGKGRCRELEELAKYDNRIQIKGFVSDEELDEGCKRATAFLSPRETEFQGTRMIFPSKILFYAKYQKPIISPTLPGLSSDYDSVLIRVANNSVQQWIDSMESVVELTFSQRNQLKSKFQDLLTKKHWNAQAKNLKKFILQEPQNQQETYTYGKIN
ncbi:hypothetical protein [Dyadobacter sp. 32]|uniref:hypothetical protein n=1 Tax=Dyadobacter sp. 32 TaxID=538966 RepID=UPI0039C7275A